MNALVVIIVVAAAASVVWQLMPVRPRYRAVRALHDAVPARGFAGRCWRGIIGPLLRRAESGLGGGCGGCAANPLNGGAKARDARPPH